MKRGLTKIQRRLPVGFGINRCWIPLEATGNEMGHLAIKNKYRDLDGSTVDHIYNWHDAIHKMNDGGGIPASTSIFSRMRAHGVGTIVTPALLITITAYLPTVTAVDGNCKKSSPVLYTLMMGFMER